MSSMRLMRLGSAAARRFTAPRSAAAPFFVAKKPMRPFSSTARQLSGAHEEETFDEFTTRYEKEFDAVNDVFELQRNLNNAFAYDLVPAPSVLAAALRAARRVNDYPTSVRIFQGLRAKVENDGQYQEYLDELKGIREELGVNLAEELFPEMPFNKW